MPFLNYLKTFLHYHHSLNWDYVAAASSDGVMQLSVTLPHITSLSYPLHDTKVTSNLLELFASQSVKWDRLRFPQKPEHIHHRQPHPWPRLQAVVWADEMRGQPRWDAMDGAGGDQISSAPTLWRPQIGKALLICSANIWVDDWHRRYQGLAANYVWAGRNSSEPQCFVTAGVASHTKNSSPCSV